MLEDDERLDKWFSAFVRDQERAAGRKTGSAKYDLLDESTVQKLLPDFG